MKFAIVIHGDPQEDASMQRALGFARAAVSGGHQIYRIFLYHDAVCVAGVDYEACPELIRAWQSLANEQGFELAACVSAADRRGIEGKDDAVREGFVIAGLGQFADCLLSADRTVVFRS